jgi:phosphoribosylformylglycinamidine (FGAM) synthase-like enzyme
MSLRELLFSESNSRFVATVGKHDRQRFEALMAGVPFACVGKVMLDPVMVFRQGEAEVVRVHIDRVSEAYTKTLDGI